MTLREYLQQHEMTYREFGEKIMYSRSYVCRLVNGKYTLSKRLKHVIYVATNGEVIL